MRLAVLSDIHGNIAALEAALSDLSAAGSADKIWVLGDLSLFGSDPVACIQQVRQLPAVEVLQGNTDRYLVTGQRPPAPAPPDAANWDAMPRRLTRREETFSWTVARLSYEDYEYLRDLPTELRLDVAGYRRVTGFHGGPGNDEFGFAPQTEDATIKQQLAAIPAGLTVMGHTHLPMDRQIGEHRVVNVGSVGMPFDGDPRACYALFDFDGGQVSVGWRRVEYDIQKAAHYLEALGYPDYKFQSARLRTGLMAPPRDAPS